MMCGLEWTEYDYKRHMEKKCHKTWVRESDERGFEQKSYAEMAAAEAEPESDRLKKEGTCSQASTDADASFRKDTAKSFVGAGVPLNKLKKICARFFSEIAISLLVIMTISIAMFLNSLLVRPRFRQLS